MITSTYLTSSIAFLGILCISIFFLPASAQDPNKHSAIGDGVTCECVILSQNITVKAGDLDFPINITSQG